MHVRFLLTDLWPMADIHSRPACFLLARLLAVGGLACLLARLLLADLWLLADL